MMRSREVVNRVNMEPSASHLVNYAWFCWCNGSTLGRKTKYPQFKSRSRQEFFFLNRCGITYVGIEFKITFDKVVKFIICY